MTIDAKELREAIRRVRGMMFADPDMARLVAMTCDGASAYAASLPREVEVSTWALVDGDGLVILSGYDSEEEARNGSDNPRLYPVRLSAKPLLPPQKD